MKGFTIPSMQARALTFAPYLLLAIICAGFTGMVVLGSDAAGWPRIIMVALGAAIYVGVAVYLGRRGQERLDELSTLGLTDSLCNLANRRALHIDASGKAGNGTGYALALIDLDGFKLVNDNYGHSVGDRLIKEIAAILEEICADEARCYRLGGDEFAIAVEGGIANILIEGICRTLLERLTSPIRIGERAVSIGASIGLASCNGEAGLTSSELLRRTDVAMYASKQGGKMRCTWFREEFDRTREAIQQLDEEMRDALENDEFTLAYQPQVDAVTADIIGVEALIRWDRGDREPVGPNIFIPIAESTGLINPIGLWVLRRACEEALGWESIKLSVNMSAAQLCNPDFPVQMGEILEQTGFPAERLELEITETCLVLDPAQAERCLDIIREFGVNVALDDFGTGYASFGFLRQFRFAKLKLDRSLIVDAEHDEASRAMMVSSISVARAMRMDVTAEGVETAAQADMARISGCDHIQGWLFHRPMTAEQFEELLELRGRDGGDPDQIGKARA